jgi:hypothetical protein
VVAVAVTGLLCWGVAGASAETVGGGVIHACVVGKGKARGTLRLVGSANACRKRRGERPLSWNVQGSAVAGSPGAIGEPGKTGQIGPQGEPGPVKEVEEGLLETIEAQGDEIEALTSQVAALQTELAGVKTTVAGTCTQLGKVTEQIDSVSTSVSGLGLNSVLTTLVPGAAVTIPKLPTPLGAFVCK